MNYANDTIENTCVYYIRTRFFYIKAARSKKIIKYKQQELFIVNIRRFIVLVMLLLKTKPSNKSNR